MSIDSELLIRHTVFGGRGRFLLPSEAFSCSKSIGCAILKRSQWSFGPLVRGPLVRNVATLLPPVASCVAT